MEGGEGAWENSERGSCERSVSPCLVLSPLPWGRGDKEVNSGCFLPPLPGDCGAPRRKHPEEQMPLRKASASAIKAVEHNEAKYINTENKIKWEIENDQRKKQNAFPNIQPRAPG